MSNQCTLYLKLIKKILKILGKLFCGYEEINFKVYVEEQKTQNSQHNVEEE